MPKLPVHGFVLAGGRSSRMGRDKALLEVGGRPMVEIAVEKLRAFCAEVSIVGNRDDLSTFAPVVREERVDCGPAAGIEAGLKACGQPWAMFVPVDVPFVPAEILRRWAETTVANVQEFEDASGPLMGCSLYTQFGEEPAFAMLRPEAVGVFGEAIDGGERRLSLIFQEMRQRFGHARYLRVDAAQCAKAGDPAKLQAWFANLNSPQDLAAVMGPES